jgi:glutaredoxin
MNNLKLVTKASCPSCMRVEAWIEENRPNLQLERDILDPNTSVADSEYGVYSSTVPLMISDDYFVYGGDNIIKLLETLQVR